MLESLPLGTASAVEAGRWSLDPDRSSVAFRVPRRFGLARITGRFTRSEGVLDARDPEALALTLSADPASLETGSTRRDAHLRSDDGFGAERHPRLWLASTAVALDGGCLTVAGELHAAGRRIAITAAGTLRQHAGHVELALSAPVDPRALGMTRSPLGRVRGPAELVVRGRLVRVPAAWS